MEKVAENTKRNSFQEEIQATLEYVHADKISAQYIREQIVNILYNTSLSLFTAQ